MYNTKIKCTYNTLDIFSDSDNITDFDKHFVRDAIYRQEFLNIFYIQEYNEKLINQAFYNLHEIIKQNKQFKEIINLFACHFRSIDEIFGLMILFSYDFMYLTHICICEFIETGIINETNIFKLKSLLL